MTNTQKNERCASLAAFSLIELMVAMTILTVLMLMMTTLLEQVQKSWRYSESRISQFREARVAFDLVTKNLSQASLNTYYNLVDEDSDGLVDGYSRVSELHFVTMSANQLAGGGSQQPFGHAVFFQAPLGFSTNFRNLNNLFNGRGYLVAFGGDQKFRPSFIDSAPRHRFRLMEFRPPAESNEVFEDGQEELRDGKRQEFDGWFDQKVGVGEGSFESHLNPLAENIIMLVISPRESLSSGDSRSPDYSSLAPDYTYDSNDDTNSGSLPGEQADNSQQVPPLVRVTMVAIDEATAARLDDGNGQIPNELTEPFTSAFKNTSSYESDLEEVKKALNEQRVNYKVFSSMVMLRSSKYSG